MAVLLSAWQLLDRRQRRQLIGLGLLSVAMGLSTVGGIAAVLPFFTALADPNAIRHNTLLRVLFQRLSFADDTVLVIVLGVAFAAVVLIANTINLAGILAINRFSFRVGEIVETLLALGSEKKTILVSAHRAAALRRYDLVFELRNGRLVGSCGASDRTTAEKARWGA